VTLQTVLWALGVWVVVTAAGLGVAAAVVASLPPGYFRNPAPPVSHGWGWATLRRAGRNLLGLVMIALGIVLSIPGVPGQGLITVLAGVLLVDFPGRHRVAVALARLEGVLTAMNRLRSRLGRAPLLPPEPPPRGPAPPPASRN